jgi:outer membrane lipoprotein
MFPRTLSAGRGMWAVLALAAASCVRPPVDLAGQFPPYTVADAQRDERPGTRVRWGGEIVETRPAAQETCVEVVSVPLDRRAYPRGSDATYGRFLACGPGFYDPAVYAPGRRVTVVGALGPATEGKVGERPYSFPRVDSDVIHLWPVPPEPRAYDPYPLYVAPYWGWGFGWGWRSYPVRPVVPRRPCR